MKRKDVNPASLPLMILAPVGLVAVIAMAMAKPAEADWSFWGSMSFEQHQLDAAYKLPTAGYDVRVYEFTPKGNPNLTCVMPFAEKAGAAGLQCFEKATAPAR